MGMQVITNHRSRPVLGWEDLTAKEREEFDYIDTPRARKRATFARYKGQVWDLGDFAPLHTVKGEPLYPWEGTSTQTAWSAVLIRYDSRERVVFGRAHW